MGPVADQFLNEVEALFFVKTDVALDVRGTFFTDFLLEDEVPNTGNVRGLPE